MPTHNAFSVAARFIKTADPTPPALTPEAMTRSLDQANNTSAWKDVGQMGLASLGVGVGARGLVGLYNMLKKNLAPPKISYPGAVVTSVPVPYQAEDPEGDPNRRRRKAASFLPSLGSGVTDYHNLTGYPAAMVAAGGLGMYGGWKGLDAILGRRRKSDDEQEVNDAKTDFEQAMLDTYSKPRKPTLSGMPGTPASSAKIAADGMEKTAAEKLSAALDELYDKIQADKLEKLAVERSWGNLGGLLSNDTAGHWGGMYLGGYALPAAAITGGLVYNRAMKSNSSAVLQKAMARRNRRAYNARPSEIMVTPNAINVGENEFEPGGEADQDTMNSVDPDEAETLGTRSRKILRGIL